MKKVIYALMFCLAVCSGAIAADKLDKPGVMDEEEIFITESLSKYDTVVVRDFTTAGAEYMNLDDGKKRSWKS